MKNNHTTQVETLQSFYFKYSSEPWQITYELPSDEVKESMDEIHKTTQKYDRIVQDELNAFSEVSRNIIQLVSFQHLLKIG